MDEAPLWMLNPAPYMQPGEVAQALGITLRELTEMVHAGELMDHRMDSGARRYSRAEVAVVYEVRAAERDQADGAVS